MLGERAVRSSIGIIRFISRNLEFLDISDENSTCTIAKLRMNADILSLSLIQLGQAKYW